MLTVGSQFPQFSVKAATKNDHTPDDFATISNDTYQDKWLCVFFWPKDFTFVCPTEIAAFGKMNGDFADRDCQLLGGSTDNEFVHMAWRNDHEDLKNLPFPMIAAGKLAGELGILDQVEKTSACAPPSWSIRKASSAMRASTICRSAAIQPRFCGCWMHCRLTSFAHATGKRAMKP